jgi:hypothetical protein
LEWLLASPETHILYNTQQPSSLHTYHNTYI